MSLAAEFGLGRQTLLTQSAENTIGLILPTWAVTIGLRSKYFLFLPLLQITLLSKPKLHNLAAKNPSESTEGLVARGRIELPTSGL